MSLSVQTHPDRSLAETARRICESRGGKWSGTKGMACCPAHDDRTPSLKAAAAKGLSQDKDVGNASPASDKPELTKERVKPFEIGI